MCGTDPSVVADGESIEVLYRQLDRLEAVVCRASACFDAGGEWQSDGARSSAAWIATRRRMPWATARRRVLLGRLRHLPASEEAWLAGDVGIAHVSAMAEARTASAQEALARDEQMLMGQAADLQFRHFARTLAYWAQLADPDGSEKQAAKVHDSRRLHLSASWKGQWYLDGVFDAIGGEILGQELKRIETELFDADWAEAKARVGEGVCAGDLHRSAAQRRADALVEMARRSAAAPAGARLPEPLFNVTVDHQTFQRVCELARGSVVTPAPWCRGWARRGCSGWSSTVPSGSRTSVCAGGCSPVPPGRRCWCGSGSASIPTATFPPVTARSTTWSPTPSAG